MKKKYLILAVLAACQLPAPAFSADLPAGAISLMKQIARNCDNIPVVDFSLPENRLRSQLDGFNASKRYFTRDSKELKGKYPEAVNSDYVINGTPFSQRYRACEEIMSGAKTKQEDYQAQKPNEQALQALTVALFSCQAGITWLETPSKSRSDEYSIIENYETYKASLKKAIALDPKVKSFKAKELAQCEANFAAGSEELLTKVKKRESQEKAAEKALAKTHGYDDVYHGIFEFTNEIKDGHINTRNAERTLIIAGSDYPIKVQSILDDVVVYGFLRDNGEFFQIAVERNDDKTYPEGALLNNGYFALVGTKNVVTVLGAKKQILVFEDILATTQQKEVQERAEKAQAKAERSAEEAEKRAEEKSIAKDLGYDDMHHGIVTFVDDIKNGGLRMRDAKRLLIKAGSGHPLKVQNLLDDIVIYGFSRGNGEFFEIALERDSDEVYLDGQPLNNGYFALTGVQDVVTVLGAQKQILLFEEITP